MDRFKDVEDRLWTWQQEQFGQPHPFWLALGGVEEVGELGHWLLKRELQIRGASGGVDVKDKIKDTLSDIGIFLLNLRSRCKNGEPALPMTDPVPETVSMLSAWVSSILMAAMAEEYVDGSIEKVFNFLATIAAEEDINFEDALREVAEDVMKRDWKTNPEGDKQQIQGIREE
jgi:NTP pyrophosphatase (non-canonical NTP hydrolase)